MAVTLARLKRKGRLSTASFSFGGKSSATTIDFHGDPDLNWPYGSGNASASTFDNVLIIQENGSVAIGIVEAMPEPSTALLAALGGLALGIRRRH